MKTAIVINWSSRTVCSLKEALDNIEVSTFKDWLDENYKPFEVWDFNEEKRKQVLNEYEKYVNDEKMKKLAYGHTIVTIDS